MANEKKKIRIVVGIILLVIGLFIIIMFSMFSIAYIYFHIYITILPIITGVFLFAIGLVFLMASWKRILAANAKEILGFILLVIGLTMIIYSGYGLYISGTYWLFIGPLLIGVVIFVVGLNLLLTSM